MSNRTEARSAKAARMHATGRLPLLRLFSTPLKTGQNALSPVLDSCRLQIIPKARIDRPERPVPHANNFDPMIFISVPFQDDLDLPVSVDIS
jgi:hypothetical protein